MKSDDYDKWFTPAAALSVEGNRAGIATCKICGAAIFLDSRDDFDTPMLHAGWHESRGEGGAALQRQEGEKK